MNFSETFRTDNQAWAKLVSQVFHPWVVLALVLGLAAYLSVKTFPAWIAWASAAYFPTLLFPTLYSKLRAVRHAHETGSSRISRALVRNEPRQLFIITGLFIAPAFIILRWLNAPANLTTIVMGVAAVMLVISVINIRYRASFHLSMVTAMLLALYFLCGPGALFGMVVLPVLSISRCQLHEHTLWQTVTGFVVGLLVGGAVFISLGLAV